MAGRKEIPRELSIYINDVQVINSLGGITREITKTNNEIKALNANSETYDQDLKRLQTTLGGLKEKQAEFKEEISRTSQVAGDAKEAFSKMFVGITSGNLLMAKEGFLAIEGAIGGMLKASLEFIATPLGATIAVIAGIALAMKEWYDYNEAIRENTRLIKNLTGLTGESVQNIRIGVQSLADTFNVEFKSIAEAIHNLTANGLAKDEFEALEQIKMGLLKAPDKNEFLASLKETALTAKQVGMDLKSVIAVKEEIEKGGLTSENFFNGLQKAAKNLETQADTLKTKMSDALGAAFTKEVLDKVKSGELTITEALVAIGKKSEEANLNQKQQMELTTAILGKAGIAAGGLKGVTDTLTEAQKKQTAELSGAEKATLKLVDANKDLQKAQELLFKSDNFNEWSKNWESFLAKTKEGWYGIFYDMKSSVGGFFQYITGLATNNNELLAKGSKNMSDSYQKQKDELKNLEILNNTLREGLEKRFAEKRTIEGKDFDFQKEKNEYIKKAQASLDAAIKSSDEIQIERKKQALDVVKSLKDKEVKINKDATADEVSNAKDASQKIKDIQDKFLNDQLVKFAKAKLELAKAELNYYLENHQTKILDEKKLTDEIVAEETKRLSDIHNKKLAELTLENNDKIENAKAESKKREEEINKNFSNEKERHKLKLENEKLLNSELSTINLNYETSSLKLYDEFNKSKLALDKKFVEEQKAEEKALLKAQDDLATAMTTNEYNRKIAILNKQYNEEKLKFKQLLNDKKISQDQYNAWDKKATKDLEEAKAKFTMQTVSSALSSLSTLAGALGEMFGQSKELAIVQANISGAQSVLSIWSAPASLPQPYDAILKGVLTAGVVVQTANQIKTIEKQKAPNAPKFFYGGHTGNDPIVGTDEFGPVTGVVHAKEWVAPEVMTQSPKYAATFTWLENERKQIVGNKYFKGGETSPGTLPSYTTTSSQNGTHEQLLHAIIKLNDHLDKGIKAETHIGYEDMKFINKLTNDTNKSISYGTVNKP